jgi:hypothetical protein
MRHILCAAVLAGVMDQSKSAWRPGILLPSVTFVVIYVVAAQFSNWSYGGGFRLSVSFST